MNRTIRRVSLHGVNDAPVSTTRAIVSVGAATYDPTYVPPKTTPPTRSTMDQALTTFGGDAMPKAVSLGTAAGVAIGLFSGGWMWAVGGGILANLGGRYLAKDQCTKYPNAEGCPPR